MIKTNKSLLKNVIAQRLSVSNFIVNALLVERFAHQIPAGVPVARTYQEMRIKELQLKRRS